MATSDLTYGHFRPDMPNVRSKSKNGVSNYRLAYQIIVAYIYTSTRCPRSNLTTSTHLTSSTILPFGRRHFARPVSGCWPLYTIDFQPRHATRQILLVLPDGVEHKPSPNGPLPVPICKLGLSKFSVKILPVAQTTNGRFRDGAQEASGRPCAATRCGSLDRQTRSLDRQTR